MTTKVVDLFAGCGGLSLGFQSNPQFEIVAAYEIWQAAIVNYQANFQHEIIQFDLANVEAAVVHIKQFYPEIIIGGPPCQDFSHAGLRTEGDRASLSLSFASIIASIKPFCFVMENVERAKKSKLVLAAKKFLSMSGYGLTEKVIDASYCGVPQKRKRYFCIGILGDKDNGLEQILEKSMSLKPMTVRDYLGDELNIEYYYRHPRNYNRRGIYSIDEPAPTIRGVNRPVPQGYVGHPSDPISITKDLRSLTTYERARIQTFPKNHKWIGTKTDIDQMIGNAVPVKLAEFIANRIAEYYN